MPRRLLPLVPDRLDVLQVRPEPDRIIILATIRPAPTLCPVCRMPSRRRHGHVERTLADLPWQGRPVRLRVRLRRLACRNPACPRRTFSERLPDVARPHARRSERLRDVQRHLGLALGGAPAARLAQRLAMPASADTLVRLARAAPLPSHAAPRVIGLDEWAWRRGRRYGTMIVDLERNKVLDLLPDRDAGSVAGWLRRHPGVEVVARDRADIFAEGARAGAPGAIHVADRWHLLRNLSVALQSVVAGHHAAIRATSRAIANEDAKVAFVEAAAVARPPTAAERRRQARHAPRRSHHAELTRLAAAGASVSGMARALGMDRKTVRSWLRGGGPPSWRKPPRPTVLDPYRAHLEQRWQEGCRNAAELARELGRLGADVRPRVVREWAMRRRRAGADVLDAGANPRALGGREPSVNRATRLLQADAGTLDGDDRRFIERLRADAPLLSRTVDLARRLADLLRRQSAESLEAWLDEASTTPLARFAAGLRRDVEAVQGAIATRWSTSPVEGQIGRLKMLKRAMYGRAGFALLRQRVLAAA
jgi:transposase